MSNPGLLAVGQFVFSSDSRIGVKISPATRQWQLSITVSSPSPLLCLEHIENLTPNLGLTVLSERWRAGLWLVRVPGEHLATPRSQGSPHCPGSVSSSPLPHTNSDPHITEPRCEILGEKSVYLNVGSSHTINCTVLSPQPPDHIFWYFNSRPLPVSQEEGWEVTSSMESGHSWSSVRLLRVSLAQSGSWECRPSNCRADGVTMTVLDGEGFNFYVSDGPISTEIQGANGTFLNSDGKERRLLSYPKWLNMIL